MKLFTDGDAGRKDHQGAAHLLHVTQPTLSRQIVQLEEELDAKRFTRNNHNII